MSAPELNLPHWKAIAMSRARRFCPYCGQIIGANSKACASHAALLAVDPHVDGIPATPLPSPPMRSGDRAEVEQPTREKGN